MINDKTSRTQTIAESLFPLGEELIEEPSKSVIQPEESEIKEKPKTPFNPNIPDPENPYNNLNNYFPPPEKTMEPGDHVIVCYQCKSPINFDLNWTMVECPQCNRTNKIPHQKIQALYLNEKLSNVRYNRYKNHLDTILPIPYLMIVCPYCKATNKVLNYHVKWRCFNCERSFAVDYQNNKPRNSEKCSLNPNSKYYKYNGADMTKRVYPPNSAIRISDHFFPDPIDYYSDYYYKNNNANQLLPMMPSQWNSSFQMNPPPQTPPPYSYFDYNKDMVLQNNQGINARMSRNNNNNGQQTQGNEFDSLQRYIDEKNYQRENEKAMLKQNFFYRKYIN